jgi:hypothetical protein
MKIWKWAALLPLVVLCGFLVGASSCEEAQGIKTIPDPEHPGHYKVIEVQDGKVSQILSTAQGVTSGIPIAGQVVMGLGIVAQLLHQYSLAKAKARVQAENDEYDRTHAASNAGLQSFVDSQPPAVGAALISELDHAHDAANVPAAHQDAIQPIPKIALP